MLWVVAWVSVSHLPFSTTYPGQRFLSSQPWLDGWARWDSGWYREIAENGYSLLPGRQSTKDFFGMGRYVLAAFPCFAAAAEVLVDHPSARRVTMAVSGAGLVTMMSFFAQGSYLS